LAAEPQGDSVVSGIVDYAIVGGGCAGTYAAWRLITACPDQVVHLYEGTPRIGGRLLTVKLHCAGTQIELGGMRYALNQVLISNLVKRLGLDSKEFNYPLQLLYLRDRRFWAGAAPPYSLTKEEASMDSGNLILFAITSALGKAELCSSTPPPERARLEQKLKNVCAGREFIKFSDLSASEWETLKKYATIKGIHLYSIGFWNLIHNFLSSEAYLFAHDGFGYESVIANWNAAEAIPWFLRDFETPYRTVMRGMDRLPTLLNYLFARHANAETHLNHQLTRVTLPVKENGPISLTFRDTANNHQETVVQAYRLILGLPREALKSIDFVGLDGDSVKRWRQDLELVRSNPLFKLFLAYKKPWWQEIQGRSLAPGRAATDLPIRQVYYYASEEVDIKEKPLSLLMGSYSDGHYVDFWKPVLRRTRSEGVDDQPPYHQGVVLSSEDVSILDALGASERMLYKAHQQIVKLHVDSTADTSNIPLPCFGLVMNWAEEPFGAGWHTWQSGVKPWRVRQRMKQPFDGFNIHVCGEAFSCEQGWVEGALRSTEMVLKSLGVPEPEWIPEDDYKNANFDDYKQYVEWSGETN
jgi:monoamine oxidase